MTSVMNPNLEDDPKSRLEVRDPNNERSMEEEARQTLGHAVYRAESSRCGNTRCAGPRSPKSSEDAE